MKVIVPALVQVALVVTVANDKGDYIVSFKISIKWRNGNRDVW